MGTLFTFLTVRTAFLLITVASLSTMVMTTIARGQPLVDPFMEYADIMPGQSQESLVERGFHCQFNGPPYYDQSCLLIPESGAFSEIWVTFALEMGRVNHVVFKPRERSLTLGDLLLLWGQPQRAIYGHSVNFRWPDRHVLTVLQSNNGHCSYLLPITYVAFD